MIRNWHIWLLVFLCLGVQGCSVREAREARETVAQADSLRAKGGMYTDSLKLVQAYETLGTFSPFLFPLSTDFAHACYHYGRLLRANDNPVAAMQCFIAATHSRTRDYHILGRVYSNMGEIAHLAKEYSLSYYMFERSAEMFIREKDSIAYYYALNDMAFELAEQGKIEETLSLIARIKENSADYYLLIKTWETKAVAYLCAQQYDSAVYYTTLSLSSGYGESTSLMVRAQAFSHLSQKDSATYYAQLVMNMSNALSDKNNALYILTNEDETKDKVSIRETASNRADIQKKLEIRQGELSQATQLLEQDINHKPNFAWLYTIIATLVITGAVISVYVSRKRKKHQLLSQQIDDLETKNKANLAQRIQQIEERCSILANSPNIKDDLCWNEYDQMCNVVNQQFSLLARKLQQTYHLSEREIRLCVLSLLNLRYDSMAEMLYYAPNGVGKFKMRVAKKLGTTAKNLQQFLIEMMVDK